MKRVLRHLNWVVGIVLTSVLVLSVSVSSFAELERVYVIVNHESSPIRIDTFGKYRYEEDNRIASALTYTNTSPRTIEAVKITIIYFDAFNERLAGVNAVSTDRIAPGAEDTGIWSKYGTPGFMKTGMAFVLAVRFLDGEVWLADSEDVLETATNLPGLEFLFQTDVFEIESD